MAQPRTNKNGTARIAVVGAESHSGGLLRAALAASKVPGSRVNLYGLAGDEAVISAYDGEARLIQDPNLPEIVAHDVVYLCEPGELAAQVIETAAPTCTVIDLIGCLPGDVDTILAHPERVGFIQERPSSLTGITAQGNVYCQLTAASIEGLFGKSMHRCAVALLKLGLVHLVASDGHSAVKRPPLLS